MDSSDFVKSTVALVICVIVAVSVAVPILSGLKLQTTGEGATTYANAGLINTILGIIPVFVIIAILIGVVVLMKTRSN